MDRIFKFGDKLLSLSVPGTKLILVGSNFENIVRCDRIELESKGDDRIFMTCFKNNECTNSISFEKQPECDCEIEYLEVESDKYHLSIYRRLKKM